MLKSDSKLTVTNTATVQIIEVISNKFKVNTSYIRIPHKNEVR